MFSTYDVNLILDGQLIETLSHGDDYTKLLNDITDGEHEIIFCKEANSDINGSIQFSMNGDTTVQCRIACTSSEVDVDKIEIIGNTDLSSIEVPDLSGEPLSAAKKILKEAGFVNITGEAKNASIWDDDNWTVLEQSIEPGETADKSTEIVLTCEKTQAYLEEYLLNKNIPETKEEGSALGYKLDYINKMTYANMSEKVDSMSDEEADLWIVSEIEHSIWGKKEADLKLVYTGNKVMPDVVNATLKKAQDYLEENDFSAVEYVTTKDSVWDENNWIVIEQSISAGDIVKADSQITLTVKHKDEFEKEGIDIPNKALSGYDTSLNVSSTGETEAPEETTEKNDVDENASLTEATETERLEIEAAKEESETTGINDNNETELQISDFDETETSVLSENETSIDETETETETEIETETETETEDQQSLFIDYTSSETAVKVQEALNAAGFDCGVPDGIVGEKTKAAIIAYRETDGLESSEAIDYDLVKSLGIVDDLTTDMINEGEDSTETNPPVVDETETTKITETETHVIEIPKASVVGYSTNGKDTVKNGNAGMYSYKSRGGQYTIYYIIDFDEGYVYCFSDGNGSGTCERLKIDSGDLNSVVIVTYHDGSTTWQNGLYFKWQNQPDHMILEDNDGMQTDFYTTNLDEALRIMRTKSIIDY